MKELAESDVVDRIAGDTISGHRYGRQERGELPFASQRRMLCDWDEVFLERGCCNAGEIRCTMGNVVNQKGNRLDEVLGNSLSAVRIPVQAKTWWRQLPLGRADYAHVWKPVLHGARRPTRRV